MQTEILSNRLISEPRIAPKGPLKVGMRQNVTDLSLVLTLVLAVVPTTVTSTAKAFLLKWCWIPTTRMHCCGEGRRLCGNIYPLSATPHYFPGHWGLQNEREMGEAGNCPLLFKHSCSTFKLSPRGITGWVRHWGRLYSPTRNAQHTLREEERTRGTERNREIASWSCWRTDIIHAILPWRTCCPLSEHTGCGWQAFASLISQEDRYRLWRVCGRLLWVVRPNG